MGSDAGWATAWAEELTKEYEAQAKQELESNAEYEAMQAQLAKRHPGKEEATAKRELAEKKEPPQKEEPAQEKEKAAKKEPEKEPARKGQVVQNLFG